MKLKLKIATYNICAGSSDGYFKKKNYYKATEVIASVNADVIALNEVGKKLPPYIKDHAAFIANECGYKYFHFACAASFGNFPYGNAILSKYPISRYSEIPIKIFDSKLPAIYEPRCILCTHIDSDIPIRVICTHLGLFRDEQRKGIRIVSELIKTSNMPTVFMGDMNINGDQSLITETFGLKLIDVCAARNSHIKTYPSANPKKRLDYIFLSEDIEPTNVYAVNTTASDHLPLVADIFVKPKQPSLL